MLRNFAPVAPVEALHCLLDWDQKIPRFGESPLDKSFGHYHLFLAHHTVEQPKAFTELIKKYFTNNPIGRIVDPLTIIMDNSLVENGYSVDTEMVAEAVRIIRHAAVSVDHLHAIRLVAVLPDVMGNGKETKQDTCTALPKWIENPHFKEALCKFMLVAQGHSYEDYTNLLNYFFIEESYLGSQIHWLGIPRVLVKNLGTRTKAANYARLVAPDKRHHLLGFSDDIWDDLESLKQSQAFGIDSAVPVRCQKILTPTSSPFDIGLRKPDWFKQGRGALPFHASTNIKNTRKWVAATALTIQPNLTERSW